MQTYVYIDASNLFYGGKKSLGWSVDFEKLYKYLQGRFDATQIYYFGGVEIYKFSFDYLANETVPLVELEKYLNKYTNKKEKDLKQIHFYQKLEEFGYQLVLKPVKIYEDDLGNKKRKANCDVEMAFYLMRDKELFERVIILSGDGDFLPVLKYLRKINKEVLVLARGPRTAKEIRRFAGDKFIDLTNNNFRDRLERKEDL